MKIACDKCLTVKNTIYTKDWLRVSTENTTYNLCPLCADGFWMAVDSQLPPVVGLMEGQ